MIGKVVKGIFGSKNERELKRLAPLVESINRLEPDLQALSDAQLQSKTGEFKEGTVDHGRVEAFVHRLMVERDKLFAEFSDEDIKRLRLLRQAIQVGRRIGAVSELATEDLAILIEEDLSADETTYYVFRRDDDQVRRVEVEVGISDDTYQEVTGGVEQGDEIVIG